ncbi:MAG: hypothetical protein ACE5D7_09415, partial [Fidelibacterota bacterium]
MTYISCQNPEYWAIAFLQDEYEREKEAVSQFTSELKHSMPRLRMRIDLGFGSARDFEESDIREYRYNFRAPYFQNAVKVGEFNNFTDAKSKLETSFGNSTANASIFDVNIISEKVQLIGLNLSQEADIFLQLDDADRKHTACMPYELLIIEDAIYMLDPRYRLAVSFPDINSKKYSKIKAIGKAIEAEINELLTN